MQSLLKFIQKYSNFLIFFILEVVAFLLLTNYNEYPKSSVLSTANSIAVWNYKVANNVGSYFRLRQTNEYLDTQGDIVDELAGLVFNHVDRVGRLEDSEVAVPHQVVGINALHG